MRNEASSTSLLPFSRNENGHYTIEIIGDSRASERLLDGHEGVLVDDFARSALMSDDYNESHRLEDGKKYTISLVPGWEVMERCTADNIQKYAQSFGYRIPPAGVMAQICRVVSDSQMSKVDIWHITALHEPLRDFEGNRVFLSVNRFGNGCKRCKFSVFYSNPDYSWFNCADGSFPFLFLGNSLTFP